MSETPIKLYEPINTLKPVDDDPHPDPNRHHRKFRA